MRSGTAEITLRTVLRPSVTFMLLETRERYPDLGDWCVTWGENTGGSHNVTPSDGSFPPRSGEVQPGPNTYSYTFTAPGTYTYYCEAHGLPAGTGMAGTVTVLAAAP